MKEFWNTGAIFLQRIGDIDLYGIDYIIQPIYAQTLNAGSKSSKSGR